MLVHHSEYYWVYSNQDVRRCKEYLITKLIIKQVIFAHFLAKTFLQCYNQIKFTPLLDHR